MIGKVDSPESFTYNRISVYLLFQKQSFKEKEMYAIPLNGLKPVSLSALLH